MNQVEALELARSMGLQTTDPQMIADCAKATIGAEVFQLLSRAGDKCKEASPSQEFMDEFQQRLQGLKDFLVRGPTTNGDASAAVVVGKRRVFLGMPRSYDIEMAALESAWANATGSEKYLENRVKIRDKCCPSLLCNGFNQLWCEALSGLDVPWGDTYDYFVLQHSDVRVQGEGWLDEGLEECDRYNFDVLHAPCGIKDLNNLTSTAVGNLADPWESVRRVSLTELLQLPLTFECSDVVKIGPDPWPRNAVLLPNTGCLIVKLGPWSRRFSGFTMKDRIYAFDKDGTQLGYLSEDGETIGFSADHLATCSLWPRVISEDWNLGFWAAGRGLKVGGTRLLRTDHYGKISFPNYEAWGEWKRDETYFKKIGVKE